MRRIAGLIGVAALAAAPVAALSFAAAPARAHDVLVASAPEDGAVLTEAPTAVELTFSNAVQNTFAQVAVLDANETPHQQGEPEVVGPTVTQDVGDLPDGDYTISYRVVSSDGHPVSGTVAFTVSSGQDGESSPTGSVPTESSPTAPPTTPASPPATTTPATAVAEDDGGTNTALVVLLVAAGAIAVAGIAYVAAGGRGRSAERDTGR